MQVVSVRSVLPRVYVETPYSVTVAGRNIELSESDKLCFTCKLPECYDKSKNCLINIEKLNNKKEKFFEKNNIGLRNE